MMKKLSTFISCIFAIFGISSAFAAIKVVGYTPPPHGFNGQKYVGNIVSAEYPLYKFDGTSAKSVIIVTSTDDKNNQSNLKGISILVDGDDLPFGLTLANAVGKKIEIAFTNTFTSPEYDISGIAIIPNNG